MPEVAKNSASALMFGLILVFSWLWYQGQSANITLNMTQFSLNVPFYGTTMPRSDILVTGVRVWDAEQEPELKPDIRSNGFDVPGFQLGWYRLNDGQKALVVAGQGQWLVIPTRQEYIIMITTEDPERLLKAI